MKTLYERIRPYASVSFVGMCKNAGKTVTMNRAIRELRDAGVCIGLTSVGRDGESTDLVTNTAKPGIYVGEGTVIATAAGLLKYCDITKEILETTGISTPLGEVVLVRACSDGFVQAAGPSITTQLPGITEQLISFGAEQVLIDGALGRRSLCSRRVSAGTILCTGASYHKDMEVVVRDTAYVCELLQLPEVRFAGEEAELQAKWGKYVPLMPGDGGQLAVIGSFGEEESSGTEEAAKLSSDAAEKEENLEKEGKRISNAAEKKEKPFHDFAEKTAGRNRRRDPVSIKLEELWKRGNPDAPSMVYVQGGLTDAMLRPVLTSGADFAGKTLILKDGSRILISADLYEKCRQRGLSFAVREAIQLLCVTVNPFSAYGFHFEKEAFREKMAAAVNVPVLNVREL